MVYRSLKLLSALMLASLASISGASEDVRRYTFDKRTIYFDSKSAFTLPTDEIDGRFKGPILLGEHVVFIEATRNLALAFSVGHLIDQKTISQSTSLRDFPMRISTQAIIRVAQGLLVYNLKGEARLLVPSFSVTRIKNLDVDTAVDGTPHLYAWEVPLTGRLKMPSSKGAIDDRYIVLDLDKREIVEHGAATEPKRQPEPAK